MQIIRLLPGIYNEADILEENLCFYFEQGFKTIIVDNGSNDGSYEICKKYLGHEVLELERVETSEHLKQLLLKTALRLASKHGPDWIVMADADEFIETPWRDKDLRHAIEEDAERDYTIAAVSHFKFVPTTRDDVNEPKLLRRMRHYIKSDDLSREKIWKHSPNVDLTNPHRPDFLDPQERRLSPHRYIMRHYPLRSAEQFERKRKRVKPSPRLPSLLHSTHYLGATRVVVREPDGLHRYEDDKNWKYEPVEREISVRFDEIVAAHFRDYGRDDEFHKWILDQFKAHSWPSLDENGGALMALARGYSLIGDVDRARHFADRARACAEGLLAMLGSFEAKLR